MYRRTDKARELWDRVDELRRKAGLSVRELAARAGVNEMSLQTTRAQGNLPKLTMIYPIAVVLDTTIEYLYAGDGVLPPKDTPVLLRMSQSHDLMEIARALTTSATVQDLEMVRRILGIARYTSAAAKGAQATDENAV